MATASGCQSLRIAPELFQHGHGLFERVPARRQDCERPLDPRSQPRGMSGEPETQRPEGPIESLVCHAPLSTQSGHAGDQ